MKIQECELQSRCEVDGEGLALPVDPVTKMTPRRTADSIKALCHYLCEDVGFTKNLDFLLVDFDFSPTVFRKQDFITDRHCDG